MKLRHSALAALVAAIWGANFVGSKIGMESFPPFLYTGLRFMLVAAVLLPFAPKPTRAEWRLLLPLAVVLGVLHMSSLILSINMGLNIAGSALIGQMGVPFSCLLGYVILKDKLGPWRISGMLIAFLGMMVIAGTPNVLQHPAAFVVAVGGAFFWGSANILLKRLENVNIFTFLAYMALMSIPLLLVLSFALERGAWPAPQAVQFKSVLALLFTAFISTIAGYGIWYRLIARFPVSRVAPYSLLTPVFGIAFGQLVFAEALTQQLLIGGAVVIVGVAIITVRRPKLLQFGEQV